jgi:DNA-directed RNA polymerase beta subunit
VPKMTQRFGYIVDGNEYQVTNLLRLKSGVYHRKSQADELLGEFNLANRDQFARGKAFKVYFDNKAALYYLRFDNSDIPLYPLLKDLGVSDDEIKSAWGAKILEINKKDKKGKNVNSKSSS